VKEFCLNNWWTLIKERFSLAQYGPMILVFGFANGLYFSQGMNLSSRGIVMTLVILFSAFFRLRLFDELKDYETDLKINPTRPLARGILTRDEVKKALLLLIIIEVVSAGSLGAAVLFVHALAIGYSLMMYEEFFIGTHLRPHLTTYAVTHTFVSVLFAATACVGFMAEPQAAFTKTAFLFLLSNWAYFNLFEFARKTYSVSEERAGVDTYSSLFGIWRALGLSLSQVVLGLLFIYLSLGGLSLAIISLAAAYAVITFVFALKKTPVWAKIFRNVTGVYLLAHYVSLVVLFGKDRL
jgi:4-hydroxybenzoate polyprenyltransferase